MDSEHRLDSWVKGGDGGERGCRRRAVSVLSQCDSGSDAPPFRFRRSTIPDLRSPPGQHGTSTEPVWHSVHGSGVDWKSLWAPWLRGYTEEGVRGRTPLLTNATSPHPFRLSEEGATSHPED